MYVCSGYNLCVYGEYVHNIGKIYKTKIIMSLTESDETSDKATIKENDSEKETEIRNQFQEDQKDFSDNDITNGQCVFNVSNKNVNDIVLQDNKNILEIDQENVKIFDMPSDIVTNNEYDAFASDNKIYRKYKLRQRKNTEIREEQKLSIVPVLHKKSPTMKTKLKEDYTCPYCFINFTTRTGYVIHVASHDRKSSFICSQCSAVFISNAELVSHKDTHINDMNVYCCEPCKLAFSEYCDFLIHKTTHRIKKQYKCPECDHICLKKYGIHKHIFTHFNRKVKCDICSKMIQSINLQKHLTEHNSNLQCGECGKQCKNKSYYRYHMSCHTGVKRFQCLYCGKGFFNHFHRKAHSKIHTGEKHYECSVCFEKFRQATDMKKHMVTHDTVKKHKCTICNKKFFHKDYLDKIHMQIHLNKLEYKCNFCEKRYHNNAGLKAHVIYVHTKEKPFKCKPCNMDFVAKGQYKRHCRSQRHKDQNLKM